MRCHRPNPAVGTKPAGWRGGYPVFWADRLNDTHQCFVAARSPVICANAPYYFRPFAKAGAKGHPACLAREGWLEVRVGVMRLGGGILHAKFGLFTDGAADAVVFAGSGNESARGVRGNYEQLEISQSWLDGDRHAHYRAEFDGLWAGTDPAVATVPLPQAVHERLIRLAPEEPPLAEAEDDLRRRRRAMMLWSYALSAPFMPEGGAATCDAMTPVTLWPHQRHVVNEVAQAWPAVGWQVVHHNHITGREVGKENLLGISAESIAIHRAVEHKRRAATLFDELVFATYSRCERKWR
jgi:hypothetical protein